MVDITTDQHFASVILEITDKDGKPAKVDGVPIWASSDETVLHPVPNPDGMGGTIETVGAAPLDASGKPLPNRITVTADADLGAGIQTITGVSEDIFVTLGVIPASVMKLTLGAASPKV